MAEYVHYNRSVNRRKIILANEAGADLVVAMSKQRRLWAATTVASLDEPVIDYSNPVYEVRIVAYDINEALGIVSEMTSNPSHKLFGRDISVIRFSRRLDN